MTKPFPPLNDHILIKFSELELTLHMMAAPSKQDYIAETIETLRMLSQPANRQTSARAAMTLVSAVAWLTDDGPASRAG